MAFEQPLGYPVGEIDDKPGALNEFLIALYIRVTVSDRRKKDIQIVLIGFLLLSRYKKDTKDNSDLRVT